MTRRVVFAKIGWMKYYEGERKDDPGPIGGGQYNTENAGAEISNFLVGETGEVHGFVHTGRKSPGQHDGLNLKRIDPNANPADGSLDGVLVVFLARVPDDRHAELGRGVRVVGWYKNAIAYDSAEHETEDAYYNLRTGKDDWVRVRESERKDPFDISGEGGMGRTNIRYPYKKNGTTDHSPWMNDVLRYVQDYGGSSEIEVEEALYQKEPQLRSAVENYAVDQAKKYYRGLQYRVKAKGKPYDLLCRREAEELFVEVKGTMQRGLAIILTRNEVRQKFLGSAGKAELFLVRDIQSNRDKPLHLSGGMIDIYSNWRPTDHHSVPFQYQCTLDKHKLTNTFCVSENSPDQ